MRCILFCVLIFGSLLPAQAQSAAEVEAGIRHYDAGRLSDAKQVFEGLIERHPKHAESAYYLGRIAAKEEDLQSAVDWLEQATDYDDTKADYQYVLSEVVFARINTVGALKKMGLARQGRSALEDCIQLDPGYAKCHESLVYYHQEAPGIVGGDVEKAEQHAKTLRDLQPVRGALVLAGFYAGQERPQEAAQVIAALERAHPADVDVLYQIGMYDQGRQAFDNAFTAFESAVAIDAEAAAASLYQIGRTAVFAETKLEAGIAALQQYQTMELAEGLPSKAAAFWRLGMLYELKDMIEEAKAAYTSALELEPDHEPARAGLAGLRLN